MTIYPDIPPVTCKSGLYYHRIRIILYQYLYTPNRFSSICYIYCNGSIVVTLRESKGIIHINPPMSILYGKIINAKGISTVFNNRTHLFRVKIRTELASVFSRRARRNLVFVFQVTG